MPASSDPNSGSGDRPVAEADGKRYASKALELEDFDDGTHRTGYRAMLNDGKQFLISRPLVEILELLDGRRTTAEVAAEFSQRMGCEASAEDLERVIKNQLIPRGLVDAVSATGATPPEKRKRLRLSFDFVLRIPLASQERLAPLTDRLLLLFRTPALIAGLLLIVLAHVAFYSQPLGQRAIARTQVEVVLAYVVALATVAFHELGHASACRYFRCKHGEVGFCLYLIFPALYVDLSRAWRLPPRQRALIDIGGVYFQLLSVAALYVLYAWTGAPYYASTIYAIDVMVVFTLNPLFKFDGYWLLVDLGGVPNLQTRALALLRELAIWPLRRRMPEGLQLIRSSPRRMLLALYATAIGAGLAYVVPRIFMSLPAQVRALMDAALAFGRALSRGAVESTLAFGHLFMTVVVFIFAFQFVRFLAIILFRRSRMGAS